MKRNLLLALLCMALYAKGQNTESSSSTQVITLQLKNSAVIAVSNESPSTVQIRSSFTWIAKKDLTAAEPASLPFKISNYHTVPPLKRSYPTNKKIIAYLTVTPE